MIRNTKDPVNQKVSTFEKSLDIPIVTISVSVNSIRLTYLFKNENPGVWLGVDPDSAEDEARHEDGKARNKVGCVRWVLDFQLVG